MGDFQAALGALLGKDALNLSPSVIARLRAPITQKRDLSARPYVYVWADWVYLQARDGAAGGLHTGADRCDIGGRQGTPRFPRGRAGKCAKLAGAVGCIGHDLI
jgi:hypothetical protein